jgi:hypothetical protein
MTLQGLNDAKHWRDRAAEMRVLSREMKDLETQSTMLKLANDYDNLADRAEDRAALSDWRRHRSPQRGRSGLSRHVPVPGSGQIVGSLG